MVPCPDIDYLKRKRELWATKALLKMLSVLPQLFLIFLSPGTKLLNNFLKKKIQIEKEN